MSYKHFWRLLVLYEYQLYKTKLIENSRVSFDLSKNIPDTSRASVLFKHLTVAFFGGEGGGFVTIRNFLIFDYFLYCNLGVLPPSMLKISGGGDKELVTLKQHPPHTKPGNSPPNVKRLSFSPISNGEWAVASRQLYVRAALAKPLYRCRRDSYTHTRPMWYEWMTFSTMPQCQLRPSASVFVRQTFY